MVGAINAPTSGQNTFDNYQAAAKKLGTSQPQDTHPGGLAGLGASATASAAPPNSSNTGGAGRVIVFGGVSLIPSIALVAGLLM